MRKRDDAKRVLTPVAAIQEAVRIMRGCRHRSNNSGDPAAVRMCCKCGDAAYAILSAALEAGEGAGYREKPAAAAEAAPPEKGGAA